MIMHYTSTSCGVSRDIHSVIGLAQKGRVSLNRRSRRHPDGGDESDGEFHDRDDFVSASI